MYIQVTRCPSIVGKIADQHWVQVNFAKVTLSYIKMILKYFGAINDKCKSYKPLEK